MITRFSPLCWALPANPSFNSKDAQAKQVLAEAGGLQRTIYCKTGMEYAEYLRTQELPGMGMGADLIDEFVNALGQSDLRGFRQFFPVCSLSLSLSDWAGANIDTAVYPTIERMITFSFSFFLLTTFRF